MRRFTVPVVALLAVLALSAPAAGVTADATVGPAAGDGVALAPQTQTNGTTVVEVAVAGNASETRGAATVVERRLETLPTRDGTIRLTDDGFRLRITPGVSADVRRTFLDNVLQRGNVSVTASPPTGRDVRLLSNADVANPRRIQNAGGVFVVPVNLTEAGVGRFSATLQDRNFTANPGACDTANRTGYCLLVELDGETTTVASITTELAAAVESGEFNETGAITFTADSGEQAQRLQMALAAPPLRANATVTSVETVATTTPVDETATPTPTPTETPVATPTVTPTPTPTGTTTTGAGGPGFTLLGTLLALAGVALGAQRVRS
jgi:hypothetical protein